MSKLQKRQSIIGILVTGFLVLVAGILVFISNKENSHEANYAATSISLTPGRNETEINITWHAPANIANGIIEYTEKENKGQFSTAASQKAESAQSKDIDHFLENEATLKKLEPSTEYIYRLGDGKGNWTEKKQFKTGDSQNFNFLMMGDPQIGSSGNRVSDAEAWENTLSKAVSMFPDSSFVQTAGDQVENPDSEEEYEGFFSPKLLEEIPMATTVGNHDEGDLYAYHANTPNQSESLGETDNSPGNYYFTYGNTLIMNLNTNNKDGKEHEQFMQETIAATENLDIKWKLVVFHHSIYSMGGHSSSYDILDLRKALVPVFDEFDIDASLMAHDHSYARSYQMKGFQPLKNQMVQNGAVINPEGTLYITANSSSGSKFYELANSKGPYAAVKQQVQVPTFMNVNVTSDSMEFTTYRTDTLEVTDSYKIIKDDSIEVVLPGMKELKINISETVIPRTNSPFYPAVQVTGEGINTEGGPYDLLSSEISYQTSPEGQISIDAEGEVIVSDNAEPGEVEMWGEIMLDGQTFVSDKMVIELVEPDEKEIINAESTWTYLDDGADPGSDWKEEEFDDSEWKTAEGPFGYPEGEERPLFSEVETVLDYGADEDKKYATSYFRTEFTIEDIAAIGDKGVVEFEVDDSVILYLNGTEIGRFNAPEGVFRFDEYLEDTSTGSILDETRTERMYLTAEQLKGLREGSNVLAAEVHQSRPDSSDLYWAMRLLTN